MPARYLNAGFPPGAWIAPLGRFIQPGQVFEIGDPAYVPSRHFRALNAEAADALRKLKDTLEARGKPDHAAQVKVDVYHLAPIGAAGEEGVADLREFLQNEAADALAKERLADAQGRKP